MKTFTGSFEQSILPYHNASALNCGATSSRKLSVPNLQPSNDFNSYTKNHLLNNLHLHSQSGASLTAKPISPPICNELSSAEIFLNLVRNASTINAKRTVNETLVNKDHNDQTRAQIQQRHQEIERYLGAKNKRSPLIGVFPLDLSSVEPIKKRPRLESDQYIDVEGDINKSEPSTPLDVGIPSPFSLENPIFENGEMYSQKSSVNSDVENTVSPVNQLLMHENSTQNLLLGNEDKKMTSIVLGASSSSVTSAEVPSNLSTSPTPRSDTSFSVASTSSVASPIQTCTSFGNENCSCHCDPTTWSVEEVHEFVRSIDICSEYADVSISIPC